jgi:tyrosinase
MTPNDNIDSEFVGASVIAEIMDSSAVVTLFSSATQTENQREGAGAGRLESAPHNTVHSRIGRDMGSFMSPLDPIFWLHHANVDRIWASAMRASPTRFPSDALWGNHEMSSFFDPTQKKMVNPRAAETLNANAWGAQYEAYETSQKASSAALSTAGFTFGVTANNAMSALNLGRIFSTSALKAVAPVTLNKMVRANIPVSDQLTQVLDAVPKSATLPEKAFPEASLIIEGVKRPTLATSALRVFLNCKNPSVTTPIGDPSYVGSVSFFSHAAEGHEGHAKFNFVLDITSTLERLSALGQYDPRAPVDVALIAIDSRNPGKPSGGEVLKPEGIRIIGVL